MFHNLHFTQRCQSGSICFSFGSWKNNHQVILGLLAHSQALIWRPWCNCNYIITKNELCTEELTEYGACFNFLLCRNLVITVNLAVQESILGASIISPIKNWLFCLSRWWHSGNGFYDANDIIAHPLYLLCQSVSETLPSYSYENYMISMVVQITSQIILYLHLTFKHSLAFMPPLPTNTVHAVHSLCLHLRTC